MRTMQVILLTHNCEGIFQIRYPIRLQEHRYVRIESVLRKNESKNVHLNLNISNWTQARKPHILISFAPPRNIKCKAHRTAGADPVKDMTWVCTCTHDNLWKGSKLAGIIHVHTCN